MKRAQRRYIGHVRNTLIKDISETIERLYDFESDIDPSHRSLYHSLLGQLNNDVQRALGDIEWVMIEEFRVK